MEHGSLIRLVDKRLGMVSTRWKDSNALQTISATMKTSMKIISRRVGASVVNVKCPSDVVQCHHDMGGVYRATIIGS